MSLFDPTPRPLRDIDARLRAAHETRARVVDEIAALMTDLVNLDEAVDVMLELRTLTARNLAGVPGASR